jgi:hypothetical protein
VISDVLSEAVTDVDLYLARERGTHSREVRARIVAVRDQMDALRRELDAPPAVSPDGRFPDGTSELD